MLFLLLGASLEVGFFLAKTQGIPPSLWLPTSISINNVDIVRRFVKTEISRLCTEFFVHTVIHNNIQLSVSPCKLPFLFDSSTGINQPFIKKPAYVSLDQRKSCESHTFSSWRLLQFHRWNIQKVDS